MGLTDDARTALSSVGLALNELLLREDRDFYARQYESGRALIEEGLALLGDRANDSHRAGLELLPATAPDIAGVPYLDNLRECAARTLQALVPPLVEREYTSSSIRNYLGRLVDWENQLYQFRQTQADPPAGQQPAASSRGDFSQSAIEGYLRRRFPERGAATVSGLKTLAGGFSKTTVMFDVGYANGASEALVIRAEQPNELLFLDGARVSNEFHVLKFMHKMGRPVAEPLWLEADATQLGQCFLVSRRAAGKNIGSRVDVNDPIHEALLRDLIVQLVRIHQTPVDRNDDEVRQSHLAHWAQFPSLTECVAAQVKQWREGARKFDLPASPLFARALEWMTNNIPRCDDRPSMLHGDYGLHNILITDDRISCLLDWESSGIGDPADDLAWLIDGLRSKIEPERILTLYEKIAGYRIPENRLRFFEVFNSLRFAVVCPRGLTLLQNDLDVDIGACNLGLRFTYFGTARLNATISQADALRTAAGNS
jgi:aminoglycoside phosphotransferase (APT) family kinase protein